MSVPSVTCIVLNYNGWRDTIACVHSVLAQDYPALRLLVVDNASLDDSVRRLRAEFPGIELLESPDNGGFSAGNNIGIRRALAEGAEWLWLLNNDTVAPPDTCAKLVAAGAASPRTGLVGTVLHYASQAVDGPARTQAWGGGTVSPSIGYTRHFLEPVALDRNSFLTFASVLIRGDVLREVGLLDDAYFMYFEDADLCFRARAAGWNMTVASGTAVLHKEGGAAKSSAASEARTTRVVTASGMRFLARHGRWPSGSPLLFLLTRLGKRAIRGDVSGVRHVLGGARDFRRGEPRAFQTEPAP